MRPRQIPKKLAFITMCVLRSLRVQVGLVAVLLSLAGGALQAQEISAQDSLRAAEGALQKIQLLMENQQLEVDDKSQRVRAFERKLSLAKVDSVQAESEMQAKKLEVADLAQAYQTDARTEIQRKLNQARHGFEIAQRATHSRDKRYRRIEIKFERSLVDLEKNRIKLSSLGQQEQRQVAYISNLRHKKERQLELQLKRLAELEAGAAEVKRQQEKMKIAKVAEAKELLESSNKKSKSSQASRVANKPISVSRRATPQVSVGLAEKKLQGEVKRARREADRLVRLVAKKTPVRPIYKNLFLAGSKMQRTNFSHLGNNMYRVEAVVSAGKQLLVAATTDLRVRIPDADDGEWYVFIYDARRASRGRLSMYKKSLLAKP